MLRQAAGTLGRRARCTGHKCVLQPQSSLGAARNFSSGWWGGSSEAKAEEVATNLQDPAEFQDPAGVFFDSETTAATTEALPGMPTTTPQTDASLERELNSFVVNSDGTPVDDDYWDKADVELTDADNLREFFLYKLLPTDECHDVLSWLHDAVPNWIAVVVGVPWIMKVALTIPVAILTARKMERDQPMVNKGMKAIAEIRGRYGNDREKYQVEYKKLKKQLGFSPVAKQFSPMLMALLQMPIHMTFFMSFRTMLPRFDSWKEEGFLWFTDLSQPDPVWAVPILCGAMVYTQMKIVQKNMGDNPMASMMKSVGIIFGVVMIPMMHMFEVGFNIYVCSNILSYIAQQQLLQVEGFRKLTGLKPTAYMKSLQTEMRAHSQKKPGEEYDVVPLTQAETVTGGRLYAKPGDTKPAIDLNLSDMEVAEQEKPVPITRRDKSRKINPAEAQSEREKKRRDGQKTTAEQRGQKKQRKRLFSTRARPWEVRRWNTNRDWRARYFVRDTDGVR